MYRTVLLYLCLVDRTDTLPAPMYRTVPLRHLPCFCSHVPYRIAVPVPVPMYRTVPYHTVLCLFTCTVPYPMPVPMHRTVPLRQCLATRPDQT